MEGIGAFLPLILIFGVFYILLIRPQQKKVKQHRELLKNLKRGGKIITITTVDSKPLKDLSDHYIFLSNSANVLNAITPILTSIPLQLLAYHIAVLKGCNIDQPRNLAKSVTVE